MKANRINILSETVVSQIKAGEVVQRPANIVKELVENSIDAGATQIDVYFSGAGKSSIMVKDNGCGMNSTDALMAFERHATSKISCFEDLYALATNGFRGEALPSISAVASVTLKTSDDDNGIGTCVMFKEGRFEGQEPCACNNKGTQIQVDNIFSNIPVRRRFMKSDSIERKHIIDTFLRIALVYPEVAFTLNSEGGTIYNLEPSTHRQRIAKVYGKNLDKHLLPVRFKSSLCSIEGFVGRPESAKAKAADHQMFFVNGRYMRHAYFHKAVLTAMDRLLPAGMQVPYFLYFDINPGDIDVNVHPTKTEIKFDNEQAIYEMIIGAVREAIGGFPQISEFNISDACIPVCTMPKLTQESATSLPKVKATSLPECSMPVANAGWVIPEPMAEPHEESLFAVHKEETLTLSNDAFIQFDAKYIIVNTNKGLMLIDQENAHERILFDEYHAKYANATEAEQLSLFDEYEVEDDDDAEVRMFNLALTRARRDGVAEGQPLTPEEMKSIVNRLLQCENMNYTPTGKRIFHMITGENISKLIKLAA